MYSMSSRRTEIMRQNIFIRQDWLNTLGLPIPETLQQFEDALVAFRDNADLLLGADAHMMVPAFFADDALWYVSGVVESMIPDAITEREWFRYNFDDRRFMFPSTREAARVANRWFHMGLLWQDFAYEDTSVMHDLVRLGVVGSVTGNWDWPFRAGGDLWTVTMRENRGPEATFVAIHPFPNDAGNNVLFAFPAADRQIVVPRTASNPLASLVWIDFMSREDVRHFMAFGHEGVHHEVMPGGAIRIFPADELPDNFIFAAVNNFDLQFVSNGFDIGPYTVPTLALAYAGIEQEAIMQARDQALSTARVWPSVVIRPREAEEGMTEPLRQFRNNIMHQIVMAPPAQFDQLWNTLYQQYLDMGAAAIIAERDAAWVETFGDVHFTPLWAGW
jgi:putative aldouronate transport system substrate-binding protein